MLKYRKFYKEKNDFNQNSIDYLPLSAGDPQEFFVIKPQKLRP
jgi:hypothetical protein